jgi:hypothetical protein
LDLKISFDLESMENKLTSDNGVAVRTLPRIHLKSHWGRNLRFDEFLLKGLTTLGESNKVSFAQSLHMLGASVGQAEWAAPDKMKTSVRPEPLGSGVASAFVAVELAGVSASFACKCCRESHHNAVAA